jgi:hypothetical protein
MVDDDYRREEPPLSTRVIKYPVIGRLFRFFTWWLIFTGIYASSSVCPFCGRMGCPVGGVGAGIVGGAFALVIEKGKSSLTHLAGMFPYLRDRLRPQTKA